MPFLFKIAHLFSCEHFTHKTKEKKCKEFRMWTKNSRHHFTWSSLWTSFIFHLKVLLGKIRAKKPWTSCKVVNLKVITLHDCFHLKFQVQKPIKIFSDFIAFTFIMWEWVEQKTFLRICSLCTALQGQGHFDSKYSVALQKPGSMNVSLHRAMLLAAIFGILIFFHV